MLAATVAAAAKPNPKPVYICFSFKFVFLHCHNDHVSFFRFFASRMALQEEPEAKRRKGYSKGELKSILEECEGNVKKAVEEIVKELSPFDIKDESVMAFEDRFERLENVSKKIEVKVYKLRQSLKDRKYRKKPELLDETEISCSQYSILQSQQSSEDLCDSLSQSQIYDPEEDYEMEDREDQKKRPNTYKKNPLNHYMSQKSRRRRVEEKRKIFSQWAEEEGVTESQLCGYFLHLENWNGGERTLAATGWKIFIGETVSEKPKMTVEEAIWLIEKSGMSQAVWLETRLRLLDRIWLPPVMHIRAENQRHRPALEEYRHGVRASMSQCLQLTITERLQHMDLSSLDQKSLKVFFKMGFGLDGSGDQSNYHQLSKVSYTTKQVMSVCFALRELKVTDDGGSEVIWSSKVAGANKPQNTRPLAVFPAKEDKELLAEFIPIVETEIREVKAEGVTVKINDEETKANCEKCNMSMIDGKMVTNLLNCGGAFCTMCASSQEESQQIEIIEAGFLINRTLEGIKDLALSLTNPETGEVNKKTGDYAIRKGICGLPITETDLTTHIPVCHSKIRSFEWTTDLVVRNNTHKKWPTATNNLRYTKEEKYDYKVKREVLKEKIYENLAINIGNPGDMVTGKAFVKFSSDNSRAFFVSLVEEEIREDFSGILLGLCAAVKVINSQKRLINTDKLRELTKEVNVKIVQCFPWAAISPSVHRILAHSWQVIEMNGGYGLGDMSEEGLEALNKLIREMRNHGSRKDSTVHNFTDTFNHLWDRSRPTIVEMDREIKRRKSKIHISTEIEALVESLFLEDAKDD